jgi:hypothetical protein
MEEKHGAYMRKPVASCQDSGGQEKPMLWLVQHAQPKTMGMVVWLARHSLIRPIQTLRNLARLDVCSDMGFATMGFLWFFVSQ